MAGTMTQGSTAGTAAPKGRIAARFAALKAQGKGALVPYLQAYDPDLETSRALLAGLPAAGAGLVELCVPFTDPAADGPSIQRAGLRALKAGATLAGVLEMVRGFRAAEAEIPLVLMGYLNPILAYGAERFCADAAAAGVDGLIVVDMPPEEADELAPFATAQGLDLIRLIAPTTDDARLPFALSGSDGFVYHVSITGITGTRSAATEELRRNVGRIRAATTLPIVIGFGIRTPEQAADAVRVADAAVVGTALIDTLAATLDSEGRAGPDTVRKVLEHVRALADAVHTARMPA